MSPFIPQVCFRHGLTGNIQLWSLQYCKVAIRPHGGCENKSYTVQWDVLWFCFISRTHENEGHETASPLSVRHFGQGHSWWSEVCLTLQFSLFMLLFPTSFVPFQFLQGSEFNFFFNSLRKVDQLLRNESCCVIVRLFIPLFEDEKILSEWSYWYFWAHNCCLSLHFCLLWLFWLVWYNWFTHYLCIVSAP